MSLRLSQLDPLPKVPNVRLGSTIGQGSFAIVKIATFTKQEGPLFAVKFIHRKISHSNGLSDDDIAKELFIHKASSGHPNIIKLYSYGSTRNWLYLLIELATGGDLFDKIEPDIGVDQEIAHFYFRQLINAMDFLHSKGIAHRDIKPENILLDSKGDLKLADFGLATVFRKTDGARRICRTACGSPPYMAPEIINPNGYDPEKSDVWACGVVLFVLLTGETPWDEPTLKSPEFKFYVDNDGKVLTGPWNKLSPLVLSLLRLMMNPEVEKRASVNKIRRHFWVNQEDAYSTPDGLCKDSALLTSKLLESLHIGLNEDDESESLTTADDYTPRNNLIASQPVADIAAMVDDDDDDNIRFDQIPATQQIYTEHSRALELDYEKDKVFEIISKDPALLQFTNDKSKLDEACFKFNVTQRLTRFFSLLPVESLLPILLSSLARTGVATSEVSNSHLKESYLDHHTLHVSVHATDRRKNHLRGAIKISRIQQSSLKSVEFVKTKGDPLEWRRFFKRIVLLSKEAVFIDD